MAARFSIGQVRILDSGFNQLTRGRLSPVGRDLQRRALKVTRRMKANAGGADGGPQVRSSNLRSMVAFLEFGDNGANLEAKIGVRGQAIVRRDWNYALILEGPDSVSDPRIELIGGHDFGEGVRRPFMAKSLLAARD